MSEETVEVIDGRNNRARIGKLETDLAAVTARVDALEQGKDTREVDQLRAQIAELTREITGLRVYRDQAQQRIRELSAAAPRPASVLGKPTVSIAGAAQ